MIQLMVFRTKGIRRVTILSILIAQALVLSIIESWIPVPVPIPGIKLGLANIIILLTINYLGARDALIVMALRTVLSSIYMGGPVWFIFSISGGLLSTIIMTFLHKKLSAIFGFIGISVAGALFHNLGQLLAALIVMKDTAVFYYTPILALSAVVMGSFTGLIVTYLTKKLEKMNIIWKD